MSSRVGIGLVVGGIVTGMAAASFAARDDGDLRARMQGFVTRCAARPPRPEVRREPLCGEAVEGGAMQHYEQALPLLPTGDLQDYTRRRASLAELLARLHDAACCTTRGQQLGTGRGWSSICNLMFREVEARMTEDDTDGAVACWLDAAAALHDVAGARLLTAFWLRRVEDEWLSACSSSAMATLSEGLERLEARIEPTVDAEELVARSLADLLADRRSGAAPQSASWSLAQRARAWRSGFDVGRSELEAFEPLLAALPVLQPVAPTAAGRAAQWDAFDRAATVRAGTRAAGVAEWLHAEEQGAQEAIAQLRLLRLAIAFHRREPLPTLADPCADAPLHVEADEHSAVFRSAGSFRGHVQFATRR